jgi:uncharacterized membrane protein
MADALGLALLVMLVAVAGMGGAYAALRVRRWSRQEERRESFTLQELREMRARGEINEQEFLALRGQVLNRAGTASPHNGPEPPGG